MAQYATIVINKTYSNNGGTITTWTLPQAFVATVIDCVCNTQSEHNAYYTNAEQMGLTTIQLHLVSITSARRTISTIFPLAIGF